MDISGLDHLYIDGRHEPGAADPDPVINPATEAVVGLAPVADASQLDAAIDAARRAFDSGPWPRLSPAERADRLTAFHNALVARREAIGELIRLEAGAVRGDVFVRQFDLPLQHLRHTIALGGRDQVRPLDPVVGAAGGRKVLGSAVVARAPVGVVAAITAYNYPFFINIQKVGPALITGNTVVLKPSPYTPFEALVLAEAAEAAGLPPGVLNVVNGGQAIGEALTSDPRVDMVSFTGSDTVGALIAGQAAPTLKRLLLELGGKSAMIIRADADLDLAAATMLRGFTAHCGQGCGMFTRSIVHNSIRKALVERVAEMARGVRVGDPADPATQMGPLIRATQRDRVERYVALGRESGAKLVTGGARPKEFAKGFFYEPTLFDDVDNGSAIAQDEIFGPVGVVTGFDEDEEAIALANDSKFGLRAGLLSADVGRAYEMAGRLRTGHVTLNGGALTVMSEVPLGGVKRSGFGREGGADGLLEYTYARTVEFHAG